MMIDTTKEENVLYNLRIPYRTCRFADSSLFFCELPDGLTFDLQVDRNHKISLWRIVKENWGDKNKEACMRLPVARQQSGFVSLKVTNEGDLIVQYDIYNINNCRSEEFAQYISDFSHFISLLDSKLT